ncbi:MAG: hypothetical protein ACT4NV_14780, partial [Rhodoferax sp.]
LIKCAISTCVGNALRVLAIPGLHQVLDGGRLSANSVYYLNSIDARGVCGVEVEPPVGVSYIRRGKSATTLSGGEALRVELAAHAGSHTGRYLGGVLGRG